MMIITYLFLKQGVVELMREIHIWHFKTIRMATAGIIMIIMIIIAMMMIIIIVMNTIIMIIVIVAVAIIHVSAIFQLNDIVVA